MGCGLSKARTDPEVLVSHRNARLTVPRPAADRAAAPGRLAAGAHRGGDGGLPQVREDVDRPVRRRGRGGSAGPVLPPALARRRGPAPRSSSGSWSCGAVSVVARTGSAPSSGCRPGRCRGSWPPRGAAAGALDPMTGEVIRASKATAVRYERDRPGELVHMDVKKLGRIPDGGGWRAHGRARRANHATAQTARSGSTTSTRWSTTTPGWPTPRSCPTRRAPTCAGFLTRAVGLLRRPRHHPDRAADDRQRLGLPVRRCARSAPSSASDRSSSGPTAPGRTARSNASTAPCRPSGPTGRSSPATTNAPPPLHPGSSTTTLNAATAHSEDTPDQPTATNLMAGYT